MRASPRDRSPDSTIALARDGYRFFAKRRQRYASDLFQTRLLFRPTVCMAGREAATIFYDAERFERRNAAWRRVRRTLVGEGGVQGLDGDAHRCRKRMLMSIMTPGGIRELVELFTTDWDASLDRWARADRIVFYDEVAQVLCRVVCAWAGVPLDPAQVPGRTDDLHALIEGAAAVGPRHARGRAARKRSERWVGEIIERVRRGTLQPPQGSALQAIAWHREPEGRLLDRRVAAVDLLNVLRPTVAVDRFLTFAAVALHEYPPWRERLRARDADLEPFVQEVRRFYPLFPAAVARVRTPFTWNGFHFPRGRRVLLDLYGTDHDPRLWEEPDEFRPQRFQSWGGDAYGFIPQGGGDHYDHHRCPGEWITIELMKAGLAQLTRAMDYDVPEQDLRISLRRIPTIPASRFVMADVRRSAPV
jgi:fatty-acid peroxygenase